MKLKIAALCSLAALLGAATLTPASAGTIDWNFYTMTGMPAPGGSETWTTPWSTQSTASANAAFMQGGVTLEARSGVQTGAHSWNEGSCCLFAKNSGTGEQGLGLTNDPYGNNEIANPYGIGLFLSQGYFTSVTVGSLQNGETYSVWGYDGTDWDVLHSVTGNGSNTVSMWSVPVGYSELVISDPYATNQAQNGGTGSNNVILEDVTSVPEPGTLALFAAGLLGCMLFLRRRARQH